MKRAFSLLLSLLLLPCIALNARADVGVRIALPICGDPTPPPGYQRSSWTWTIAGDFEPTGACPAGGCPSWAFTDYYQFHSQGIGYVPLPRMDFGNGNEVLGSWGRTCLWGTGQVRIDANFLYPNPLIHLQGFVSNINPVPVHGQLTFGLYKGTVPLTLAIQVLNGNTWTDVKTVSVQSCDTLVDVNCAQTSALIDATVPPNSDVRLELRKNAGANYGNEFVIVEDAELFGAECFPDAANPGACIQQ